VSKKPRGKLCQWTDDETLRAIEYAQSGTVSINEAAGCCKISPTTVDYLDELFIGPRWMQSLI